MGAPSWLEVLSEGFYRRSTVDQQNRYGRGEIYWAPVLYQARTLKYLYPRAIDPYGKAAPMFEIRSANPESIRSDRSDEEAVFGHIPLLYPDYNVRLEDGELYAVLTAKKRPVTIVSSCTEPWVLRGGLTRDECFLVAPMYSFHEGDPEDWKQDLKDFKFREIFYLPPDNCVDVSEGYVRFDQMQIIPKTWLARRQVALNEESLLLLDEGLQYYLTGGPPAGGVIEGYIQDQISATG